MVVQDLREHGRGFTMRKVRGRGGEGSLVVRRGFVRSRHESQFAVAAYGLVVPTIERELWLPTTDDERVDQRSSAMNSSARRRA